jgi:hypothetical protein
VPDVELTFSSSLPQKMAAVATTLPKDISKLGQEVKLFGKWDTQEYAPRLLRHFFMLKTHNHPEL